MATKSKKNRIVTHWLSCSHTVLFVWHQTRSWILWWNPTHGECPDCLINVSIDKQPSDSTRRTIKPVMYSCTKHDSCNFLSNRAVHCLLWLYDKFEDTDRVCMSEWARRLREQLKEFGDDFTESPPSSLIHISQGYQESFTTHPHCCLCQSPGTYMQTDQWHWVHQTYGVSFYPKWTQSWHTAFVLLTAW